MAFSHHRFVPRKIVQQYEFHHSGRAVCISLRCTSESCLVCPCRAFNEYFLFFVFSSDLWVFIHFLGYLGLKRPHIFGEKTKKNENPPTRIGSARTHQTRAKFQGLTLKNDVDIWTFVRLSAKITAWHRNYLVLEYVRF